MRRGRARRSPRGVLADWEETLARFVKVMPRDYRAALERLAAGNGAVHYPDEHPVSSGGEGFVTAEIESGTAA